MKQKLIDEIELLQFTIDHRIGRNDKLLFDMYLEIADAFEDSFIKKQITEADYEELIYKLLAVEFSYARKHNIVH